MSTNPKSVKDGDLIAYVDGEASPAGTDHITQDPALQQEAADLFTLDLLLQSAARANQQEKLLLYASGQLTGVDESEVAPTPALKAQLAELMAVPLNEPVSQPNSLWEKLVQTGKSLLDAVLLPPPAPQPAMAWRGTTTPQLTFQAGDYEVTLEKIAPLSPGAKWQLEGQVTRIDSPAGDCSGTVHLVSQATKSDIIDELGFFMLTDLEPDAYQLYVELDNTLIPIPTFTLP